MRAFPRLSMVFESWQRKISSNAPQSTFSFGREVYRVVRDAKGVAVFSHDADSPDPERNTQGTGERKNEREERFDELIMCTDADAALKILGEGATWAERRVLGNVKVSLSGCMLCVEVGMDWLIGVFGGSIIGI